MVMTIGAINYFIGLSAVIGLTAPVSLLKTLAERSIAADEVMQ